ncbi:hypothetical protein [Streptomyces xanthophaeus]|uniref:hypothetical protein n=1 Tax=Streptomyces xanthophaeus TaxID=67385 RepID=UPI00386E895B
MLRPRDRPAVLVADLDLDQRRDWLDFGLLRTRRPELHGQLTGPSPRSGFPPQRVRPGDGCARRRRARRERQSAGSRDRP